MAAENERKKNAEAQTNEIVSSKGLNASQGRGQKRRGKITRKRKDLSRENAFRSHEKRCVSVIEKGSRGEKERESKEMWVEEVKEEEEEEEAISGEMGGKTTFHGSITFLLVYLSV